MFKKLPWGNCLEVQWLRLQFPVQGPRVSSLVGELRSHILHGTTKKRERKKSYYFEAKFLFSDLDSGSESSVCSRIGCSLVLVSFPQFSSLYTYFLSLFDMTGFIYVYLFIWSCWVCLLQHLGSGVPCSLLAALRYMRSSFPNQGWNLRPLHGKVYS